MPDFHKNIDQDIARLRKESAENTNQFESYIESSAFRQEMNAAAQKEIKLNLREHIAKSILLIPSRSNDSGRRNITTNQDSFGVNLIDARTRRNVTSIIPNRNYLIQANIVNRGDLYLPTANVEFFVSKKRREEDVEFIASKIAVNFLGLQITGRLEKGRIVIGDVLKVLGEDVTYTTRVNGITQPATSSTFHTIENTNAEVTLFLSLGRNLRNRFKSEIKIGDVLVNANTPLQDLSFRMRVEDSFTITGRGTVVTGKVEQGVYDFRTKKNINVFTGTSRSGTRNQLNLRVTGKAKRSMANMVGPGSTVGFLISRSRKPIKRGDIIETTRKPFTVTRRVHVDSKDIKDQEFVGRTTTHLDAFDAKVVHIPWKAPSKKDRRDYIFTVRTFSLSPYDMPDNFDLLNPSKDRHVGSKKIIWHIS